MATEKEDEEEVNKDSDKTGETEEAEEPAGKKGSSKKLFILAAIVVVVLAAGGGAVFFAGGLLDFAGGLFGGAETSGEKVAAEHQEGDASAEKGEAGQGEAKGDKGKEKGGHGKAEEDGHGGSGPSVDLKSFLVNLADPGRRRYLRTTLNLSLHREADTEVLEEAKPRIRDAVLMLLSSKLASELLTVDGKVRLHDEIVNQVNATLSKEIVAEVYFVDFIIQ